jgi:hypothetical protein
MEKLLNIAKKQMDKFRGILYSNEFIFNKCFIHGQINLGGRK